MDEALTSISACSQGKPSLRPEATHAALTDSDQAWMLYGRWSTRWCREDQRRRTVAVTRHQRRDFTRLLNAERKNCGRKRDSYIGSQVPANDRQRSRRYWFRRDVEAAVISTRYRTVCMRLPMTGQRSVAALVDLARLAARRCGTLVTRALILSVWSSDTRRSIGTGPTRLDRSQGSRHKRHYEQYCQSQPSHVFQTLPKRHWFHS